MMEASHRRVVIHLDLDCFYAQVEAKRLGIDPSTPLAVQQWSGLIAVNYPARRLGVKRHLTVAEAKRLVPELVCVHVETRGGDGRLQAEEGDEEHDATTGASDSMERKQGRVESEGVGERTDGTAHDRQTRKVSLRRYRRASWRVMHALAEQCACVERASIDEAYIDVTEEVDAATAAESSDTAARAGIAASGAVVALEPDVSEPDRRLAIGAAICARVRAAVWRETGYTMSGGVAHNKMLAKLASARNKPDQQTCVSRRAVAEMMGSLPMRAIKGLGGKLGERVEGLMLEQLGAAAGGSARGSGRGSSYQGGFTAAALAAVGPEVLGRRLEARTAAWLACVARGEDEEAVVPNVREGVKSVNAFKSFAPVTEAAAVHRWLRVLADELAERLVEDRATHSRAPRHLRSEFRCRTRTPRHTHTHAHTHTRARARAHAHTL